MGTLPLLLCTAWLVHTNYLLISLANLVPLLSETPIGITIHLRPDYLLAKAAQLLLVILTVAHIFNKPADPALTHHDHNSTADDTHPFAQAFRQKPWSLIFAPTWLLSVALLGLSAAMSWARLKLLTVDGDFPGMRSSSERTVRLWGTAITGIIIFLVGLMGIWVAIPMFSPTIWISTTLIIVLPLHIGIAHIGLGANVRAKWAMVGYVVLLAIFGGMTLSSSMSLVFASMAVFVLLLAFYECFVGRLGIPALEVIVSIPAEGR